MADGDGERRAVVDDIGERAVAAGREDAAAGVGEVGVGEERGAEVAFPNHLASQLARTRTARDEPRRRVRGLASEAPLNGLAAMATQGLSGIVIEAGDESGMGFGEKT